jgi:hypothetical protein
MTTFSEMGSESLEVKAGHAAIFSFPSIASEPAPSVTWQSEVGSYSKLCSIPNKAARIDFHTLPWQPEVRYVAFLNTAVRHIFCFCINVNDQ